MKGSCAFLKGCVFITLMFLMFTVCLADIYTVTNTDDSGDGSLRQAILDANGNAGLDTILFASNVRDTITAAGFEITEGLTIIGPGADLLTIDGNLADRVFHIECTNLYRVSISGLTIARGRVSGAGAGIYVAGDTLVLSSCRVCDNVNYNQYQGGGGIYQFGGCAYIDNCTVSGNTCSVGGAGMTCAAYANVTITNSTINDNSVTQNPGFGGGGIYNAGTLTMVNCTVSGNIHGGKGGGIYTVLVRTHLNNVTVTNNTAPTGGGLYVSDGDTVYMKNTIVGGNTGDPGEAPDCDGVIMSEGYNLIQDVTGATIVGDLTGNITGLDPNLGPLDYNMGSTKTHALLTGSPAIDAGDNQTCAPTDQRGIARPQDGDDDDQAVADIGSFELIIDADNDGVADIEEMGADSTDPNYDGNSDGIADSQQGNVASLHTYSGAYYVTFYCPEGFNFSNVQAQDNPSPDDAPEDVDFLYDFFGFKITGMGSGGSATVILYLPDGATPGMYYKYGQTPDMPLPHWYEFNYDGQTGAEISANIVTKHFIDGQRGDDDITANAVIIEPGGPGEPVIGISDNLSGRVPSAYALTKISPNPFTGETLIRYELPKKTYVSLCVYNSAGRLVEVIEDGEKRAGYYSAKWSIRNREIPSGIYFVHLDAGEFTQTRKIILTKN